MGIIQKTAIDSGFGESGPISTGGLKKGKHSKPRFYVKKVWKGFKPLRFQPKEYLYLYYIYIYPESKCMAKNQSSVVLASDFDSLMTYDPKKTKDVDVFR